MGRGDVFLRYVSHLDYMILSAWNETVLVILGIAAHQLCDACEVCNRR